MVAFTSRAPQEPLRPPDNKRLKKSAKGCNRFVNNINELALAFGKRCATSSILAVRATPSLKASWLGKLKVSRNGRQITKFEGDRH